MTWLEAILATVASVALGVAIFLASTFVVALVKWIRQ